MKKRYKTIGSITMAIAMAASIIPANVGSAYTPGWYSYFNEYTIGHDGGIRVYYGGSQGKTVDQAGITKFDTFGICDDPFASELDQEWDAENLTLSQPISFTDKNGKVHIIDNMLTNYDFIADPTAIDNYDVDGKLYVYGTTEGFSYGNMSREHFEIEAEVGDKLKGNGYRNHSLTILSTSDMVNWTDEGFMDSWNITNLPSSEEADFVKSRVTGHASWAPSGLKYDLTGDGDYKYYLFYTNGGATGYVMSDSPTGPWEEPEGGTIFSHSTPNCSDCNTCFDPAVLVDDKGDGYVYFGGLSTTSGRACKILFDEETGKVSRDGDPVKLPTYRMFEDNEINQFDGKYYYSYCAQGNVSGGLTDPTSIAVYVSSDPLNVSFDPTQRPKGEEKAPFTDENGVYRHFLGTVLKNTSTLFGEHYNNHHHMQEFRGHYYMFYHSTVLHNTLHRVSCQYRNLHVDEIDVDTENETITGYSEESKANGTVSTFEGPEQIEAFNPYFNYDKSEKYINATTSSSSAGVKSTRDDKMVLDSRNGSPMVLDSIETGDWTRIQGVDFGTVGAVKFGAEISSNTSKGAVEVFLDDPTDPGNFVVSLPVKPTEDDEYEMMSVDIPVPVKDEHDVYFVFRGSDYKVASWKFDNEDTVAAHTPTATPAPNDTPAETAAPTAAPTATTAPAAATATPALEGAKDSDMDYSKTYAVGKLKYKLSDNGTATVTGLVKSADKTVTVPVSVKYNGKTYKVTAVGAGAFGGSKNLSGVTIGRNVQAIGAKAFFNCPALKKVTVKSSVIKTVGKNAFKGTAARLTISVPKKKLAAYKKIFKGKGQNKRARIK